MAKFRMWKDRKTNDYKYADRVIKSFFDVSGSKMLVHRYIGTYDSKGRPVDGVKIQDLLFMETRDRRYANDVIELMSIYEMSDDDFELSQFGFMSTDTLYLDFHLNEMVNRVGRKLASGDVIEIIHLRDDLLEDHEGGINTFYVVQEGRRPVQGFHANWLPHMWRVRVKKITDSPMYDDILDDNNNFLSTLQRLEESNDAIVEEGAEDVPEHYSEVDYVYNRNRHGMVTPPSDMTIESLSEIERSTTFPYDPEEGQYIIRTDYQPQQLFQYIEGTWRIVDIRDKKWIGFHEYTTSFVENENEWTNGIGENKTVIKERGYITNPLGIEEDEDDNDD